MSVLTAMTRLFGGAVLANGSAHRTDDVVSYRIEPRELPAASLYGLLKTLYLTTGAYDDLANARVILGRTPPQMKAIRSPVSAIVNAWGSKLYPTPLTVVADNAAIVDPIDQVWRWSNWRAKQSTFGRFVGLYGEAFHHVQASQETGRVWWEYLEPMYVTAWEEDPRGYLTFVRVDILRRDDDLASPLKTHTETWSSDEQVYRRWETEGDAAARKLKDLGDPAEEIPFRMFGIDFVPFVRTPFLDLGERGIGAVQLALEAIFEADLSATNLHGMLYQDGDGAWVATAAGVDANGRPMPPLTVANAAPTFDALGRQTSNGTGTQTDGSIAVGKRSFWRLPPGYDLKSVVADINYLAGLAILQDHDQHIERLSPALAYARLAESGGPELSGRAIRYKLTAFIDQVTEVRATALEKLAQADAMALTLGKVNGIDGFRDLGDFDRGDYEHTFEDVDVVPLNALELAEEARTRAQAIQAYTSAGFPLAAALKDLGYTDEQAAEVVDMAVAEAEEAAQRQEAMLGQMEQQQGDGQDA